MSGPAVIGLAGGIGSGKSTVAASMQRLGCVVLDADKIAHGVLNEPAVQEAVQSLYGDEVMTESGHINRSRLAAYVFSSDEELKRLEAVVHPRVDAVCRQRIEMIDLEVRAIVLDAPLLFEAKLDQQCDTIIFLDTPEQVRHERLMQRSGWDAAEASKREAFQLGLDEKRSRSHYVLVNAGNSESLHQQVIDLLDNLYPRHD
jgi:dephospho-CoA kinase